jgi:hypothetical protein
MDTVNRSRRRSTRHTLTILALASALAVGGGLTALAHTPTADGPDALLVPPPPVVADYFPAAYRAQQILSSASVDARAGTVTLPLHEGRMRDGAAVWYVVTDTSDRATARRRGLNWSPKLRNAPPESFRTATRRGKRLIFDAGTVDFSPERRVVPGPASAPFPPAQAVPGSVGDARYSPLVRVRNERGTIYNATVVSFDTTADEIEFPAGGVDYTKVIDRAVAISPSKRTVTLSLNVGTASDRPVLFISLDSSSPLVSALEATTHAPALAAIPVGRNDAADSAVSANYIVANGPTGADNPQRQGLDSALSDPGAQVLDVFDGAPGVLHGAQYSPMWDLYVARWTDDAIAKGYRGRIGSELAALGLARRGWLTGLDGGPLTATGLISNCPLIAYL